IDNLQSFLSNTTPIPNVYARTPLPPWKIENQLLLQNLSRHVQNMANDTMMSLNRFEQAIISSDNKGQPTALPRIKYQHVTLKPASESREVTLEKSAKLYMDCVWNSPS